MAEQHDTWLQGLGLDLTSMLALRPRAKPAAAEPPADGELPFGLLDVPPDAGAEAGGMGGNLGQGSSEWLAPGSPPPSGNNGSVAEGDGGHLSGRSPASPGGQDTVETFSGGFDSDGNGKATVSKRKSQDGSYTETIGELEISDEKAAVTGRKREVDVTKGSGGLLPPNRVFKFDVGEGTASVERSAGEDGMAFGMQANAGEASVTYGTSGTRNPDGNPSDLDQTTRVGVSEGEGFAVRVHYGDDDHDGNPEFGGGFDAGPVSFDVKSEDPLRTGIGLVLNAPLGPMAMLGQGAMTEMLGTQNLTKQVIGDTGQALAQAKQLAGAAQQGVSDAIDGAEALASEAAEQVGEAAGQVAEQVADAAGEVAEQVADAASEVADQAGQAIEQAGEALETAVEGGLVDAAAALLPE